MKPLSIAYLISAGFVIGMILWHPLSIFVLLAIGIFLFVLVKNTPYSK
jgi:hypothetical protein